MELTPDFKELLELFNEKEIKYLIIGGYAVNNYGYPRYTHDIDLWVWINKNNAIGITKALAEFGFANMNILIEDFLKEDNIVQLGVPPNRVDIMTTVDGLDFMEAFRNKNNVEFEGVTIPFISLKDLITNKQSTARLQDLADAEQLIKIDLKKNKK